MYNGLPQMLGSAIAVKLNTDLALKIAKMNKVPRKRKY